MNGTSEGLGSLALGISSTCRWTLRPVGIWDTPCAVGPRSSCPRSLLPAGAPNICFLIFWDFVKVQSRGRANLFKNPVPLNRKIISSDCVDMFAVWVLIFSLVMNIRFILDEFSSADLATREELNFHNLFQMKNSKGYSVLGVQSLRRLILFYF